MKVLRSPACWGGCAILLCDIVEAGRPHIALRRGYKCAINAAALTVIAARCAELRRI